MISNNIKYKTRQVEIEAIRWSGNEIDLPEMLTFIQDGHEDFSHLPMNRGEIKAGVGYIPPTGQLDIPTLEGDMLANPGDFIIKGLKGEFYPCKPDIFEMKYELIV